MQQTEIVPINEQHPDPMLLERAARLIKQGELVVFPTETVYGLGADAFQLQAVEQIFAVKGRPLSDPLIVHIADEATLDSLVIKVSREARQLIRIFWPGPLTLVLQAGSGLNDTLIGPGGGVGVRVSPFLYGTFRTGSARVGMHHQPRGSPGGGRPSGGRLRDGAKSYCKG